MRRMLTVVLTVLFAPLLASAQPVIQRVPDDAIVYVGWQGAKSLGEPYQGSHLQGFVNSTDWEDFYTRFLPQVLEKLGKQEREFAEFSGVFKAIAQPLWDHSGAFYFGGVDYTNRQRPVPKVAFYCEAGEDAPALVAAIRNALAKVPGGDPRVLVSEDRGTVTVTVGQPPINAKSLATAPGFQAIARQGHKSPALVVYVDGERLVKLVDDTAVAAPDHEVEFKERWPLIRDALGLNGFKRALWTGGFDGKGWATFATIEAPAPRTGLLQFLDGKPLGDEIVKTIPATAVMASAGRFDLTKLFDAVREGGERFDPEFAQNYGAVMGYVGGMIGVEPPALVEPFGDQWAYYTDPNVGGNSALGLVIVNKLDDPAKAADVLTRAERGANRTLQRQLPKEVTLQFKQSKRDGVDIHYFALPIVTPAWAIDGDRWYFALYPQIVAAAVAESKVKDRRTILDNPAYVAARERLGTQAASGVGFVDVPAAVSNGYPGWLAISRYAGFGDIFGVDSPLMLVPTLPELKQHLTPAASVCWSDERGWYLRSTSAFPGSETFASDPVSGMMVYQPAMMASILLPSLNRARETANRVKSASNLRQIGQGMLLYANENRQKYPPDLGALVTTQDMGVEVFVNPRTGNAIPNDVRQADPPTQAEWVLDNSDYVYKGAGKNANVPPDAVLAHEKPDGLDDGINILYGDGHVEFVPFPRAMQEIGQ